MMIKRMTVLLAALVLMMGLVGCGEKKEDAPGNATTTTTPTTTVTPLDDATKDRMVTSLLEAFSSMTSYSIDETVQASFEANGTIVAASEIKAKLTETPDALTALCEQQQEEGLHSISLYNTGERVYVKDGDCRFTLEMSLSEMLKKYGIVTLKKMPGLDKAALAETMTLVESEGGYTLSCSLSGNAVTTELATYAQELLGEMNATLEDANVVAFSVTVELSKDGTPTRIAYYMAENVLSDGNFLSVAVSVDATFTATGDAVTLTVPEDLTSYEAAETEYSGILNAVLDENGNVVEDMSKVYDSLVAQYGKELVDSVLYMIGVTV